MTTHRLPEETAVYNDQKQVSAYANATRRMMFDLLEKSFANWILEVLKIRPNPLVVDLGTGPARVPGMIARARQDLHVTGVDASALMLNEAAESTVDVKNQCGWKQADVTDTGLPSHQYDAVITHLAFHEFPDPEAVLIEALRLVKPGGVILIQDLRRPSALAYHYSRFTSRLYYLFSSIMRRQTLASLSASYSANEVEAMLTKKGISGVVKSTWIAGLPVFRLFIQTR